MQVDPTLALTSRLFLEAERTAQRFAAGLRLFVGAMLLFIASRAQADAPMSGWLVLMVLLYFAIGIASLAVTHPRIFATAWAPFFVVIDVLWYYSTLLVELFAYETPPNEFATMPVFTVLFVLIALAGMRYTPWALLAGLATFAVLDTTFYLTVMRGAWPGVPLSDDPRFGFGDNVFRIAAVAATGLVVGLTSLRARRTLVRVFATSAERDTVKTLFGRYLPEAVAAELVEGAGNVPPRSGIATVLMLDIQGFTRLSEGREPASLVTMMNAFFQRVEEIIYSHGGTVAHFQGDGVLATFNLPIPQPDHADRAIAAAVAIERMTHAESFAGTRLNVRIGIATGSVTAGVVGGAERLTYTVYGDVVNVAARLEQANKRLGTRVLVAETTAAVLEGPASLRDLGEQQLAGRAGRLRLLTPAG